MLVLTDLWSVVISLRKIGDNSTTRSGMRLSQSTIFGSQTLPHETADAAIALRLSRMRTETGLPAVLEAAITWGGRLDGTQGKLELGRGRLAHPGGSFANKKQNYLSAGK